MENHPLFELIDVSYQVGDTRILSNINWRADPGEHWALLGRNGAGKTTLLKILCGYIWPNAGGDVWRLGSQRTDLRSLRLGIGWVTSTMTEQIPRREKVIDTVVSGRYASLGLSHMGWRRPTPEDYRDAESQIATIGIDDLTDRPFGVLSQGERQKVLLARACMARPMLTILDEPCAGLDPASRESFLAATEQLAESPGSPCLIMVTHHIEEIMPAFDNTLVLADGLVAASGQTREILDQSLIERLYGGAVSELISRNGRIWPIS